MFMTLKRPWPAIDASKPEYGEGWRTTIHAGRHEIEEIPNPYGKGSPWLVLKGTKIGNHEELWRQWKNGDIGTYPHHHSFKKPLDWGDWEIIFE